uniref:lysozyme n=1 Tax=Salvator merianae TaxID=96440 RepID=A0A8D0BDQ6_SALMN
MNAIAFAFLCLSTITNEARKVRICDLYYTLKLSGLDPFKGIYSEQYVCAADKSSQLNTLYYENIDGIPRYGIFQLSGLEWCNNGRHASQNKCKTSCDSESLSVFNC